MITMILRFEADGAKHPGFKIDEVLADNAGALGYSQEELPILSHAKTKRTRFENHGDWAKAKMTDDVFHEKVGKTSHRKSGKRRECKVYQITQRGLDELRKRS